jgi:hypothetical protein
MHAGFLTQVALHAGARSEDVRSTLGGQAEGECGQGPEVRCPRRVALRGLSGVVGGLGEERFLGSGHVLTRRGASQRVGGLAGEVAVRGHELPGAGLAGVG